LTKTDNKVECDNYTDADDMMVVVKSEKLQLLWPL